MNFWVGPGYHFGNPHGVSPTFFVYLCVTQSGARTYLDPRSGPQVRNWYPFKGIIIKYASELGKSWQNPRVSFWKPTLSFSDFLCLSVLHSGARTCLYPRCGPLGRNSHPLETMITKYASELGVLWQSPRASFWKPTLSFSDFLRRSVPSGGVSTCLLTRRRMTQRLAAAI